MADKLAAVRAWLDRVERLHARYRAGEVHASVPPGLAEEGPLEPLVEVHLPRSHAALEAASVGGLFHALPVAFDPAESIGPYLAIADRDPSGEPYRFIDMGALIATQVLGENDPDLAAAVLADPAFVVSRYAHSEYQTVLSLRLKTALDRIAPRATPRHFVVNTGAEAVENAIKAVLLNRVRKVPESDGGWFVVSFEGGFHGRTLGALAVTHRRRAKLGFPTFDWPSVAFPFDDPRDPDATRVREEKTLKQVWDLLVTGRLPHAPRQKEQFARDLEAIDAFLSGGAADPAAFVARQRARLEPEVLARSRRVAAVLVEPIQGEAGVRTTSARFMQRLRLLTAIHDVPLVFDEVQTGLGATGRMWAHELFQLPLPPDAVVWAKKAQNGCLFVSEDLSTFFQEEKKFNTTWEGDSVGMLRLLATLERLDLEQVARTGALARAALERLAAEFPEIVQDLRGAGVMLGFDVPRGDWRDAIRDRAFRRGLILLPGGERTLRFYPRYDIEPYAIEEAARILRGAITDIVGGGGPPERATAPEMRPGSIECAVAALDPVDLTGEGFPALRAEVCAVELERYGDLTRYPPDVQKSGRRPLLQYPPEVLATTLAHPRALGVALRDRVSGRIVAYALGSPLENHDESGVQADPHMGEGSVFYLLALASLPSLRNAAEVDALLLERIRANATAAGFEWLSTLIEKSLQETGPAWLREGKVLRTTENYLRSGVTFVYVQVPLQPARSGSTSGKVSRSASGRGPRDA